MHRAASQGFERQADVYQSARPDYHHSLVARFVETFGDGVVVDLGAGTGKFTAQLVGAGLDPIAIEPVAAMRAQLIDRLPGIEIRDGTAESIPLDDDSVDTVVVAQAFHWFRYQAAIDEIARVLAPGGALVTVWNVRDNADPLMQAYTNIIDRYAGDTPRHRSMDWKRAIEHDGRFVAVDDFAVDNPWPTDVEGVIGRAMSTSFIGALAAADQNVVAAELRELAEPYGPQINYAYRGELQAWRLLVT